MPKFLSELSSELKYEILGIILFTGGIICFISLLGLNTGPVGIFIAKILKYIFGIGAPIAPIVLVIIGSRYVWLRKPVIYSAKFIGYVCLYFLTLAIFHHFRIPYGQEILPDSLIPGGGLTGGIILFSLRKLLGVDGSLIVLCSASVCALIMSTTWSLTSTLWQAKQKASEGISTAREAIACSLEKEDEDEDNELEEQAAVIDMSPHRKFYDQAREKPVRPQQAPPSLVQDPEVMADNTSSNAAFYLLPPLSILKKSTKQKPTKVTKEITENAKILEATLEDFGVSAKIVDTSQGPAVTRYELEPAPGVKVSKIVNLADDLALKLASTGIRIEAPIPGKAAIGIEVPNKHVAPVPLRDVLESNEFQKAASHLSVALGKDIAGDTIVADMAKMPHLLVAGATGSGKSVCINTIITSILFKATPNDVKFVLIDPKVVELSNYNGIPHLLTPVVTDCKKAASALNWAVQEMENRYALFAAAGVRDIARYNQTAADKDETKKLPLIIIIIDELADLMMAAPVDVEDSICRLAQKARAAGLHLILATQRPSVDVITGTIKANVPSRISFAVSSQIDSRTILDMSGAEKLLGKGDMLFYPVGAAKPVRVQGAFIGDDEVEQLVNYIQTQGTQAEYVEEVTSYELPDVKQAQEIESIQDELLEDAVRMILETGQASVSMLQRKFRIGYTRAARLIDTMEEMQIVGPNNGSKAREILMTSEQVFAHYFDKK